MNEHLRNLIEIMHPPEHPLGAIGDWCKAEAEIGSTLPDDYKEFVRAYGTGAIGKMPIWIVNGLVFSLKSHLDSVITAYDELFSDDKEQLPYSLYPSEGGLLPCAATGNGDYIHWLTIGCPNEWRIVFHNFGRMTFERFDVSLIHFIAKAIEGKLDVFPKSLLVPPVKFTPTSKEFSWQ